MQINVNINNSQLKLFLMMLELSSYNVMLIVNLRLHTIIFQLANSHQYTIAKAIDYYLILSLHSLSYRNNADLNICSLMM